MVWFGFVLFNDTWITVRTFGRREWLGHGWPIRYGWPIRQICDGQISVSNIERMRNEWWNIDDSDHGLTAQVTSAVLWCSDALNTPTNGRESVTEVAKYWHSGPGVTAQVASLRCAVMLRCTHYSNKWWGTDNMSGDILNGGSRGVSLTGIYQQSQDNAQLQD